MLAHDDNRIAQLAAWLEERGVAADHLHQLEPELEALERPPGVFRRWTRTASTFASKQWRHLLGELQESRDVMDIIRRARAGEPITPAERDQARAQLHDLLRMAPAGLLVLALEFFPIPGTGLLAPWALMRLGLMPSRWREAHLLHELRQEADRLRARHLDEEAAAVEALERTLTLEGEARDAQATAEALLSWWDADGDGEWDDEEIAAYEAAIAGLQADLPRTRHQKRWYVSWNHHVFGPARLDALVGDAPDGGPLLVRRDDQAAWVRLGDLTAAAAD
jgi:hypothetical protein